MADNGSLNPEQSKPEVKVMFTIGVNKDNQVTVTGDLNHKELCYHLLAEAVKIVTDYSSPAIIKPGLFDRIKHNMLNFARHLKRGG